MAINTVSEQSIAVDGGGRSAAVSVSAVSAQSSAIYGGYAVVYATVACFVRQGSNPTALDDGTDQYIPAGVLLRLAVADGNKLAFIAAEAGTVYITPGA